MPKLKKKERNEHPPLTSVYASHREMLAYCRASGIKSWSKPRHWKKDRKAGRVIY